MELRKDLMQVQSENWHNNGAHGEVDPAVMADIGYTPFEDFDEVIDQTEVQESVDIHPSAAGRKVVETIVDKPKRLTSAEQNANALIYEAEHRKRSQRQIIDDNDRR